jgi:hypothetical protein
LDRTPVVVTSILVAMLLHCKIGQHGVEEEKALRKQDRRQTSETDGTDRPDWSAPVFRYTSKVNRQVLRFFITTSLAGALRGPATTNVVGIPMTLPDTVVFGKHRLIE